MLNIYGCYQTHNINTYTLIIFFNYINHKEKEKEQRRWQPATTQFISIGLISSIFTHHLFSGATSIPNQTIKWVSFTFCHVKNWGCMCNYFGWWCNRVLEKLEDDALVWGVLGGSDALLLGLLVKPTPISIGLTPKPKLP